MKKIPMLILLALLMAGITFSGCSKSDHPTVPTDFDSSNDQNITPTSFPELDTPGDDRKDDRVVIDPANLIGTWKLTQIYPINDKPLDYDLTYTFEEEGSGQIIKGDKLYSIEWTLNEIVLKFKLEDKTWAVAAYLVEEDLYTVEWGEKGEAKDDKKDDKNDKNDKKDKKDKKYIKKMKFVKEIPPEIGE